MAAKNLLFICLLFWLKFVVSEKINMTRDEIDIKCAELLQLEPDEVEDIHLMKHIDADERKIHCFIRCFLTGMNVMNTEGELTVDEADRSLKNHEFFSKCIYVSGSDSCEKAVKFYNCVSDEAEKHFTKTKQ